MAGRDIAVGIVGERQPCLLLALRRHCQMTHGGRVDLFAAVKVADRGKQVAEREHAADSKVGQAESGGDVLDLAALLDQPGEGFPLRYLVRIKPCQIFDQRGFDGGGIVARVEDRTRQQRHVGIGLGSAVPGRAAFLGDDLRGMKATASGDDLITIRRAVRADDDRRLSAVTHVGLAHDQLVERDEFEFHVSTPCEGSGVACLPHRSVDLSGWADRLCEKRRHAPRVIHRSRPRDRSEAWEPAPLRCAR